jgi:hypothetical protein
VSTYASLNFVPTWLECGPLSKIVNCDNAVHESSNKETKIDEVDHECLTKKNLGTDTGRERQSA